MSKRGIDGCFKGIKEQVDRARKHLMDLKDHENAEKWTRKYINDLPNAAFAVVEKGYSDGDNKSSRHLPHHNSGVKSATENSSVDISHLRNAYARANQIKSVLGTESDSVLRKKAVAHLEKHRAVLKKAESNFNEFEKCLWEKCEQVYNKNIAPLLNEELEEENN